MEKLLNLAVTVDVCLLLAVRWFIRLCVDWLGVKRIWVERSFVVLYGVLAVTMMLVNFVWMMAILQTLVVLSGWLRTSVLSQRRMMWLFDPKQIVERFACVVMSLCVVPIFLIHPDTFSVLLAASVIVGLSVIYATVLPPDDGERGKKAKLTHEKLVALFGTSWMPTPVPQPL